MLSFSLLKQAFFDALLQLDPRVQFRNPVMFVTYLAALFVTFFSSFSSFDLQIAFWLWCTLLFANFSSALAEGRGKAQAASLKKTQQNIMAKVRERDHIRTCLATELKK